MLIAEEVLLSGLKEMIESEAQGIEQDHIHHHLIVIVCCFVDELSGEDMYPPSCNVSTRADRLFREVLKKLDDFFDEEDEKVVMLLHLQIWLSTLIYQSRKRQLDVQYLQAFELAQIVQKISSH